MGAVVAAGDQKLLGLTVGQSKMEGFTGVTVKSWSLASESVDECES